ncbi:hypothetical protein DKG71_04115 [Streptomyces sp. NEAU-S7GS2]|nr:hypothetical protein DKG71_04115 [Streptomyces sp. NEAU-S7GS2]
MLSRGDLTDKEWEVLEPLLPEGNNRCGRWRDHRQVIYGISHRLAPQAALAVVGRRDLGEAAQTRAGHRRRRRRYRLGINVDSTSNRAHQHAAGAPKAPPPRPHRQTPQGAAERWKDLTFYRPSKKSEYVHIDSLFGEAGKNVIDWDLIESQFRHLMKVAASVREGAISSSTLLKRLRSGSHKNSTYTAFREVGRVIRTVQLLRYLSDAPLRRRVTAATNKVESFNRFSQRVGFGNQGVLADNDPIEQEKAMKFNALLTNTAFFTTPWTSRRSSASSWRRTGTSTRRTWPTSRRT